MQKGEEGMGEEGMGGMGEEGMGEEGMGEEGMGKEGMTLKLSLQKEVWCLNKVSCSLLLIRPLTILIGNARGKSQAVYGMESQEVYNKVEWREVQIVPTSLT